MIGNVTRFKLKKTLVGIAALSLLAPISSHANVFPGRWIFDGFARPTSDGQGNTCVSSGGDVHAFDSDSCNQRFTESQAERSQALETKKAAATAAAAAKAEKRATAVATLPGGQNDFRVTTGGGARIADGLGRICIRDGSTNSVSGDCTNDTPQGSRGDEALIAAKQAERAAAAAAASDAKARALLPVAPGSDLSPGERGAYVMRSYGEVAGTEIRDGYGRSCIKDGLWRPGLANQECDPELFSEWAAAHQPPAPLELAKRISMPPPDVTAAYVPDPNGPAQPDEGPGVAPPTEAVSTARPVIDNSLPDFPITKYEYDPGIPAAAVAGTAVTEDYGSDDRPLSEIMGEEPYEDDAVGLAAPGTDSGAAIPPAPLTPMDDEDYGDEGVIMAWRDEGGDDPDDDKPFLGGGDLSRDDENLPLARPEVEEDFADEDAWPPAEEPYEGPGPSMVSDEALPSQDVEPAEFAEGPRTDLADRVAMPPPDVTGAYVPDPDGPAQPDPGPGVAPAKEKMAVIQPIIDNRIPEFPVTRYEYDAGEAVTQTAPVGISDDDYPDAEAFVEDTYEEEQVDAAALEGAADDSGGIPPADKVLAGISDDEYPDAQAFTEDDYEPDSTPEILAAGPLPGEEVDAEEAVPAPEPAPPLTEEEAVEEKPAPEVECPPVTIQMEPGRFDFDQWRLRPELMAKLDDIANKLKTSKCEAINIVGHTDRIGTKKYNQKLSERRANAAMAYLVQQHGIDPSLISTSGMGESSPVTSAEQCRGKRKKALIACLAPDRRIEVTVRVRGQDLAPSK